MLDRKCKILKKEFRKIRFLIGKKMLTGIKQKPNAAVVAAADGTTEQPQLEK